MTIQEQIIKEFKKSGLTIYRLSKETGITQSNLSLFLSKKTGMGSKNMEKLRDFFKMVLPP